MRSVLFICLGNICRSPAAEGVFKKYLKDFAIEKDVVCDSAGTSAYHSGEEADPRMQAHAKARGYELTSLARQFDPYQDFNRFDYIITMDNKNYSDVLDMDPSGTYCEKVFKMVNFCKVHQVDEVPDPYHKGDEGFEHVLDIIEDSCLMLAERIRRDIKS